MPKILSQILPEKGVVCKKITGILMQKILQWETVYPSKKLQMYLVRVPQVLKEPANPVYQYLLLNLKLKVSKIASTGNNYSAYGEDPTNKNNTVDKMPLKQRKCSVEKLLLYYFYSLHDRNILYHQMSNGDKKTELLQISLGYLSKIKHAWSFVTSDYTPIHREYRHELRSSQSTHEIR